MKKLLLFLLLFSFSFSVIPELIPNQSRYAISKPKPKKKHKKTTKAQRTEYVRGYTRKSKKTGKVTHIKSYKRSPKSKY